LGSCFSALPYYITGRKDGQETDLTALYSALDAQNQAKKFQPHQTWQDSLLSASELGQLFSRLRVSQTHKNIYRELLEFLITGKVPASRCEN
jgi:hypothetical protein